jgi:hypothetical protein
MKFFSMLAALGFALMAASVQARPAPVLHAATFRVRATGTNDSGRVQSAPLSSRSLLELCAEGNGFQTRGLALAFDAAVDQLVVINVTNQFVECVYLSFSTVGEPVTSADGTQRRRLANVYSSDFSVVGTAVLTEHFTFNSAHEQTGYSMQAALQMIIPVSESTTLGSARPTIATGKLTVGKKL